MPFRVRGGGGIGGAVRDKSPLSGLSVQLFCPRRTPRPDTRLQGRTTGRASSPPAYPRPSLLERTTGQRREGLRRLTSNTPTWSRAPEPQAEDLTWKGITGDPRHRGGGTQGDPGRLVFPTSRPRPRLLSLSTSTPFLLFTVPF